MPRAHQTYLVFEPGRYFYREKTLGPIRDEEIQQIVGKNYRIETFGDFQVAVNIDALAQGLAKNDFFPAARGPIILGRKRDGQDFLGVQS